MSARFFLMVIAVAVLSAIPLQAADLTFFVGGVHSGSVSYHSVRTALDNSPVLGFRFRTNFVPLFGAEHTLAFSSDYLFPVNTAIKEAKGFVYNSNLIIDVPVHKVVPYLTAGAGLIRQYGDSDLPVGTKFAFNYGGGLKFPRLAGPLGLRFDLRGYRAIAFSGSLNLFEASGGLLLSFK
jgi:hypothetical protein